MIVEISNKKENYLNNLGLLKGANLDRKNSVRLVTSNDKFKFNVNSIEDRMIRERLLKTSLRHTIRMEEITTSKNRQEEKRLESTEKNITKMSSNERAYWEHNIADTKARLTEIESNTSRQTRSAFFSRPVSTRKTSKNTNELITKINSYTSMLGPDNDLSREEIRFRLTPSRMKQYRDIYEETVRDEDYSEFGSIQRSLMRTNDLESCVRSLKSRAQLCRLKMDAQLVRHDRNVRYGSPLPNVNVFRQLRLMAKNESLIR